MAPTQSSVAKAIRATRGVLRHADAARVWVAESPDSGCLLNCNLVYFNGAFSPPTRAHAHIASTIATLPCVDALWMDPEPSRPKKPLWLDQTLDARVEMCDHLLADLGLTGNAGVGTLRKDLGPDLGSSIELFHTLRSLLGGPGHGRLIWALGADVLDNMRYWAEKARTFLRPGVTCDGFLVFERQGFEKDVIVESFTAVLGRAPVADELITIPMPEHLAAASSHKARKALVESVDGGPEESPLLLPVVHNLCMAQPDVLKTYRDQVVNTPDATPTLTVSEDPKFPDALSIESIDLGKAQTA